MRIHRRGGADLVWYGAAGNRTRPAVTGLGILGGFRGMLVRDGYLSYDTRPARARQCLAHLCSRNASRGGDGAARLRPPALDAARSLQVRDGHNGRRLLDGLGDVPGTDAVDVTPALAGQARGGLHAAFRDEDAEVCAFEAAITRPYTRRKKHSSALPSWCQSCDARRKVSSPSALSW